ncbi:MAG: TrbC/VirB2 family protein [Candidatus Saccharibacteria bacterium]|nr:TrbC/VirB2 family protein [Candidatus Saccharibacteria bacterium]
MNSLHKSQQVSEQHAAFFLSLFLVMCLMFPEIAYADAPWQRGPQKIIDMVNSGFARSCAIIAVMGLGFAGLAKKLSWGWALSIIGGIVLIFGASSAVDFFAG